MSEIGSMVSNTESSACDAFLLWPNGWMHQDATWYGSRPRPRPHCVRWGPSSRERGLAALSLFSAHVYCGHGCPAQLLLRSLAKVVSLDDFIFHLYKPEVEPYAEVQFLPMLKLTAVFVERY